MAPPQEASPYRPIASYSNEAKRMRTSVGRQPGFSTTTRASTGVATSMTNKGSVYKAQRGKAVNTAAVKSKSPTTHRRRGRKGKSVYRGVCVTREGKWRAVIYKERKQLYLGVYESEVDAAKAHDRAARFHFAENAVCNFENEDEADKELMLQKELESNKQEQGQEDYSTEVLVGVDAEDGEGAGEAEEDEVTTDDGNWYDQCYDMYASSSTDSITDSPEHEGVSSADSFLSSTRDSSSSTLPSIQHQLMSPLAEFGFPFPEDLLGYDVHASQKLPNGSLGLAGGVDALSMPFGHQNHGLDPYDSEPPPTCNTPLGGIESLSGDGVFFPCGLNPYLVDATETH
ncbi:unnamed protein product [Choristocarpus tenellus]